MDLDLESYAQEVLEKITNNKNLCDEELELIINCFEIDNKITATYPTELYGYSIIKLKTKFFSIDYYYYGGDFTYELPFSEVVKRVETVQVTHWDKI